MLFICLSASLKTHQGPGKEQRACPGLEAAGEVLRRCEEQLEATGGVEDGTGLCREKYEQDINPTRNLVNMTNAHMNRIFSSLHSFLFSAHLNSLCVFAATPMCVVYFYQ